MVNTSDFEKLSQSYIQMLSESSEVNIAYFLRENYDYIENILFQNISRMRKVSRYNVLADILKELGIKNVTVKNLATAISRIRNEKGVDVRRKKVKSKSASTPTKQGNTTAPKVNGAEPSVFQNKESNVNNLFDMDISPEVINSIKINIDDTDIDMNIELARLVQEFDSRKEKEFIFSEMDRQLLIYFTNYAFKLSKNLTELSLAIEDYHTTLKDVLKYFKFKCNQLKIDFKLYGKSKA